MGRGAQWEPGRWQGGAETQTGGWQEDKGRGKRGVGGGRESDWLGKELVKSGNGRWGRRMGLRAGRPGNQLMGSVAGWLPAARAPLSPGTELQVPCPQPTRAPPVDGFRQNRPWQNPVHSLSLQSMTPFFGLSPSHPSPSWSTSFAPARHPELGCPAARPCLSVCREPTAPPGAGRSGSS